MEMVAEGSQPQAEAEAETDLGAHNAGHWNAVPVGQKTKKISKKKCDRKPKQNAKRGENKNINCSSIAGKGNPNESESETDPHKHLLFARHPRRSDGN